MRRAVWLTSLVLLGCSQDEQIDYGGVCIEAQDHALVVEASSHDCAADHRGASFECSITFDGMTATIGTVFVDGKDPDDSCAGSLETTCEATVTPGTYTLEFAGEQGQIEVPGGARICFPGGFDETGG